MLANCNLSAELTEQEQRTRQKMTRNDCWNSQAEKVHLSWQAASRKFVLLLDFRVMLELYGGVI